MLWIERIYWSILIHRKKKRDKLEKTVIDSNYNSNNIQDSYPTVRGSKRSDISKSPSRMKVFDKWLDLTVYERNNIWQRDKLQRLDQEKNLKNKSTLQECTFKPKLTKLLVTTSPEKYGTFDVKEMIKVFRANKKKNVNSYSSQRTLKEKFNGVNKPKFS